VNKWLEVINVECPDHGPYQVQRQAFDGKLKGCPDCIKIYRVSKVNQIRKLVKNRPGPKKWYKTETGRLFLLRQAAENSRRAELRRRRRFTPQVKNLVRKFCHVDKRWLQSNGYSIDAALRFYADVYVDFDVDFDVLDSVITRDERLSGHEHDRPTIRASTIARCIRWTGTVGQGKIQQPIFFKSFLKTGSGNYPIIVARRAAFEFFHGLSLPDDVYVLPNCKHCLDVLCINPLHHFLGVERNRQDYVRSISNVGRPKTNVKSTQSSVPLSIRPLKLYPLPTGWTRRYFGKITRTGKDGETWRKNFLNVAKHGGKTLVELVVDARVNGES